MNIGKCVQCGRECEVFEHNDTCVICTRLDSHAVALKDIYDLLADVRGVLELIQKYWGDTNK